MCAWGCCVETGRDRRGALNAVLIIIIIVVVGPGTTTSESGNFQSKGAVFMGGDSFDSR